jgi:hypothetical protein
LLSRFDKHVASPPRPNGTEHTAAVVGGALSRVWPRRADSLRSYHDDELHATLLALALSLMLSASMPSLEPLYCSQCLRPPAPPRKCARAPAALPAVTRLGPHGGDDVRDA